MALPTASDNPFPSLLITEGTEPAAPAAGKQRLYIDSTTHHLSRTNSSGTERDLEIPAFVGAKAYNSATQTMNGSGTNSGNTIITFNSEEYDSGTIHDTGSNTSRLTIPTTGKWAFGFFAFGSPPSAGTLIDVLLNGATPTFHGARVYGVVAGVSTTWNGSFVASLTAADYLELQLNNPNASTFTIGHASAAVVQTAFWAQLIGT